eukprot:CAMPEP_0169140090 /NCGR_PEP_ID=MMETSP1015-20121227/43396_1 /TAXON_ID=342587 /ORGANISM="Karlodinium micrum, Strain CCMP2283" /LENGTH=63 /DNA_ID=CAMNT_0009205997 /DNA_START=82 /DNA_END=269 /DNA_ORIENTATION=+
MGFLHYVTFNDDISRVTPHHNTTITPHHITANHDEVVDRSLECLWGCWLAIPRHVWIRFAELR